MDRDEIVLTSPLAIAIALIVTLLAFGVNLFAPTASLGRATLDEVSEGLTCQCGCGLTVANCNMPTCGFAVPMRSEISAMIDNGMNRDAIIGVYRTKFGEKVLSAPTARGFNLLAWIMPFAALLIGAALIVMMLSRWRHATPATGGGEKILAQGAPLPSAELKGRLEEEVRREF